MSEHGDTLEGARAEGRSEDCAVKLRLREGSPEVQCPLCLAQFDEGDPAERCSGCAVQYHTECLTEFGGCATAGCAERDRDPVERVVVARELAPEPTAEELRNLTVAERYARAGHRDRQHSWGQRTVWYLDEHASEVGWVGATILFGAVWEHLELDVMPSDLMFGVMFLGGVILFLSLAYQGLRKVQKKILGWLRR